MENQLSLQCIWLDIWLFWNTRWLHCILHSTRYTGRIITRPKSYFVRYDKHWSYYPPSLGFIFIEVSVVGVVVGVVAGDVADVVSKY